MDHICILILIIVFSGVFGGIVNFFRNYMKEDSTIFNILKSITFGLAASILVPLLLKMISSNLLESSKTDLHDYFVITGFCIISAIFATNFIDSIAKKVLNQIGSVKDDLENAKSDLDASTTEPDIQIGTDLVDKTPIEAEESEILFAIYTSKYTYRSITGLSKELRDDKETIKDILKKLVEKKLVIEAERKSGIRWKLSDKGSELVANLDYDESST